MNHLHVKESFSYWATNPQDTVLADVAHLELAAEAYPFCQLLHFIKAKSVATHQPERTEEVVKLAAAYALNRATLRRLIQNEFEWSEQVEGRQHEWLHTLPVEHRRETYSAYKSRLELPDLSKLTFFGSEETETPFMYKQPLPETPPIDDTTLRESNLQSDLAQLKTAIEEAQRRNEQERQRQMEIIDSFIENEAATGPIRMNINDVTEQEDLLKKRNIGSIEGVVSEGLAKLMVRQGKIERAIEIYEQLMLKKPEKSAYFAEKIKELNNE